MSTLVVSVIGSRISMVHSLDPNLQSDKVTFPTKVRKSDLFNSRTQKEYHVYNVIILK